MIIYQVSNVETSDSGTTIDRDFHHGVYYKSIRPLNSHVRTAGQCYTGKGKSEGKAIPLQASTGPEGSRRLRLPHLKTIGTWRW